MAEKPICKKCNQAHWHFNKCAPDLPAPEAFEEPEAPREPVPPGSLKPWGQAHPNSDQFGPPVT